MEVAAAAELQHRSVVHRAIGVGEAVNLVEIPMLQSLVRITVIHYAVLAAVEAAGLTRIPLLPVQVAAIKA
jgi:hypothetical protein